MRPRAFRSILTVLLSATAVRVVIAADHEGRNLAPTVSIAAAANLTYVVEALDREFERHAPEVKVVATLGASGNLFAHIQHGAPFDLFLSADTDYPRRLVENGAADKASFAVFARGRLALWATRTEVDLDDIARLPRNASVRKIAIARPEIAPYGRAAQAVFERFDAWNEVQAKLVVGENISQTAQFVETGNADAGFVALSLLVAPGRKVRGHWREIPAAWHPASPLDHAAVLTLRGAQNDAARRYGAFLQSEAAQSRSAPGL